MLGRGLDPTTLDSKHIKSIWNFKYLNHLAMDIWTHVHRRTHPSSSPNPRPSWSCLVPSVSISRNKSYWPGSNCSSDWLEKHSSHFCLYIVLSMNGNKNTGQETKSYIQDIENRTTPSGICRQRSETVNSNQKDR